MHETGVVRDLVRQLERIAQDGGAERLSCVVVWLGALESTLKYSQGECRSLKRPLINRRATL
jgi:Zn finger protein HypA/HybF involved in hydrogenase expression